MAAGALQKKATLSTTASNTRSWRRSSKRPMLEKPTPSSLEVEVVEVMATTKHDCDRTKPMAANQIAKAQLTGRGRVR